jgi:hypothetical protein
MTFAIHSSTPAPNIWYGNESINSASFSPPVNSLIVLYVADYGSTGSTQLVNSVSDNKGLTWHFRVNSNLNSSATPNMSGTVEFWYANCPDAQSSMVVTCNMAQAPFGYPQSLVMPIVFYGAASTQTGRTVTASNQTSTPSSPSVSLSGIASTSILLGALITNNSTTFTFPANNAGTINGHTTNLNNSTDHWSATADHYTGTVGNPQTLNISTSIDAWQFIGLEVQAFGTSAGALSINVSSSTVTSETIRMNPPPGPVSVSDSATTSESVPVFLPGLPSPPNVSDTITSGEAFSLFLTGQPPAPVPVTVQPPTPFPVQLAEPHLNYPFEINQNTAEVNEQGSLQDIFACVQAICDCIVGSSFDLPGFGVPDVAFQNGPPDMTAFIAAVQDQEPRATESIITQAIQNNPNLGAWLIRMNTNAEATTQ